MRCLDSRNQESVPRSFKSSRDESPWGFQDAGCPTLVDSLASRSTSRLVVGASFFSGSTGCHHQIEVDGRGERQKTAFVAVFAESERASLPFNSFEYDSTCAADCLKYSSRTAAAIHRIFVDRGRSETQNLQGWIALSWLHAMDSPAHGFSRESWWIRWSLGILTVRVVSPGNNLSWYC